MIDVVHDIDMDTWRSIDHGERPVDWEAWLGHPDAADYLTVKGKDVLRRAAADLTAFFRPGWLDQAIQPHGPGGPRIPGLGGASPVMALTPADRPGAYIEAIRRWASLQLMVTEAIDGHVAVRRDARNDIGPHRLMHTLAQARLAAIGLYQGADVAVEPGKAGGPGDVLWRTPYGEIFIEIVTFGPDETRELEEALHHRHWRHLSALASGPIYWEGYVPGFLNKTDEAKWIQTTTAAAARCLQTGQAVEIPGADGTLAVRPGRQPEGTGTHGPPLDFDFTAKLAHMLDRKGAQTRGAGIAWIWVEDYGGIHPIHPFIGLPLGAKIPELARIAQPALADRVHVAGITWSGMSRRRQLPADEDAQHHQGLAIQRGLPLDHLRQTVIVHRNLILPAQTRILAQACRTEPHWLDWALGRLGIANGAGSLLAKPSQRQTTSLWTPSQRDGPTPQGLVLPGQLGR